MNIIDTAFKELFPDKDVNDYRFSLTYSGKFTRYNANVKYSRGMFGNNKYDFNLSRDWISISDEIRIGLIQSLLQKIFKTKKRTLNQDLYENFLKNVHIAVPKDKVDRILKDSFDRVNEKYFLGLVEMPNLVFGQKSFSKLGSYQYGSDTITISEVFYNLTLEEKVLLDYVMYHEMLHKIHKFKTVNGRSRHHTTKFRNAEKQFEGAENMEDNLRKFLKKKKFRNYLGLD